jgi:hypothetical protein
MNPVRLAQLSWKREISRVRKSPRVSRFTEQTTGGVEPAGHEPEIGGLILEVENPRLLERGPVELELEGEIAQEGEGVPIPTKVTARSAGIRPLVGAKRRWHSPRLRVVTLVGCGVLRSSDRIECS